MTAKEIWNILVEYYNNNKKSQEREIQLLLENYFCQYLGYCDNYGAVDSLFSLQIGSLQKIIPDIILKKNTKSVAIIEMKRFNLDFRSAFEKQLFSYLKELKLSIGLLVCNQIYLYSYEYFVDDSEQEKVIIPFEKDNELGIRLVELLSCENFDVNAIKTFVTTNKATIKHKIITKEKKKMIDHTGLTPSEIRNMEFWVPFNKYAKENGNLLKHFKRLYGTTKEQRYELRIGKDNTHIAFTRYEKDKGIGVEFYTRDKSLFDVIKLDKDIIENELGVQLEWLRLDGKHATRIKFRKNFYDTDNIIIYDWLIEIGIKFKIIFGRYL